MMKSLRKYCLAVSYQEKREIEIEIKQERSLIEDHLISNFISFL